MEWHFGRADEREGFTASPITFFSGKRLQSTIRECIQNSLDAATGGIVDVGLTLSSRSSGEMPGLGKLVPYLESALREETQLLQGRKSEDELDSAESIQFYKKAMEVAQSDSVLVLGVHDWGTSGLSGAVQETQGVKPSPWLALIRGQGVDVKNSADSLGSFGQGAKAPFSLSQLRTIFYLSKSDEGDGDLTERFIGKSILSSGWKSASGEAPFLFRATGFYAEDEHKNPATGDKIPTWAVDDRASLTRNAGTSIFIPSPLGADRGDGGFEYALLAAILLNFYFAIESGTLRVTLPSGLVLDSDNVREITLKSNLLNDESQERDELQTLRTLVWSRDDHRGHRQSEAFGQYFFAISVSSQLTEKRVGIARKTGMLITKRPPKLERFPGTEYFDLFVCVQGQKGSSILRDFENPSHDAFEFDRVSNSQKRKAHQAAYQDFEREIRDLIAEFASSEVHGEMLIDDLDELLGSDGGGESGENEARVEFPNRLTVTSKRTRSKHDTIFHGKDQGGPEGSGGSGSKAKQKGSSGDGDKPGEGSGNRGGRLWVASDILLSSDVSIGRYTLYFSVDKKSKPAALQIYQSGETSLERLRISLQRGSALIGSVPFENWEKVGVGARRYQVTFYSSDFLSGVEAFTEDAL